MNLAMLKLDDAISRRTSRPPLAEAGRSLVGILLTLGLALAGFLVHLNLASAISLHLLLVVLIALRWGFGQATVVSFTAVGCLDFLFTPPLFQFSVGNLENWISLATFEATALLVSRLSWNIGLHATEQESQRQRIAKLYALSNAILLIDGRASNTEQLSALMREFFQIESVAIWVAHEAGSSSLYRESSPDMEVARRAYQDGIAGDHAAQCVSQRVLRVGTTPIGAMVLRGWDVDPSLADAAASLIAVALERARSVQKENRAEAARNTEQLRTAVLDALAHGFKTPLTAIQTASSGLLAIGQLSDTQTELITIIDQEAASLARLTTRLLQTAAIDAREIRVRSVELLLKPILLSIVDEQDEETRARIQILEPIRIHAVKADAQLIKLALTQLVDNAVKYSGVGSMIEIVITQDESQTLVVFTNQGTPIGPEETERIFERFYRGSSAARGPTGTGLGLSIVKKIAEAHGGTVSVQSEGEFIRFSFSLMGGRGTHND